MIRAHHTRIHAHMTMSMHMHMIRVRDRKATPKRERWICTHMQQILTKKEYKRDSSRIVGHGHVKIYKKQ